MPPLLLFAPETLNIAETTRMIEVARAAQADFACHFMSYGGEYEGLITAAGFPLHRLSPLLTLARAEELFKADRMERGGRFFTEDELTQRVTSELALYAELRPVAVVIGFTLSVYLSARAGGVPLVAIVPLTFTRPFLEAGLATWPDALAFPPLTWLPQTWRDRWINVLGLRLSIGTHTFNRVGRRFGVPPFARTVDLLAGDETLVTGIPALSGLAKLPPHWHYVGPIFARLDGEPPPAILALAEQRPLIYCAMGSSANREVLVRTLMALAELPYHVIAPVKRHLTGLKLRLPAHIHTFDWLPAHKVNPLADLAVIHGGEGTVQTACWSGTPFVGVGLQPEQEANIEALVRQGMAIRLRKHGVTPARLSAAVTRILHDGRYRERARTVQALMQAWPGPQNAAAFLQQRFAVPV
jgi:UDP:flavonoid glycosyltransferase YjiC (YdhE family)